MKSSIRWIRAILVAASVAVFAGLTAISCSQIELALSSSVPARTPEEVLESASSYSPVSIADLDRAAAAEFKDVQVQFDGELSLVKRNSGDEYWVGAGWKAHTALNVVDEDARVSFVLYSGSNAAELREGQRVTVYGTARGFEEFDRPLAPGSLTPVVTADYVAVLG